MTLLRWSSRLPGAVVYAALLAGLFFAFLYAPPEAYMGQVYRIMYFHISAAWTALTAFTVVFAASLSYLLGGGAHWDLLGHCAAEVGVFFTTVTLLSGSIWGRAVWLTWWTWEPLLTATLILWFLYAGYLLVRGSAQGEPARMRLSAVWAVLSYVDVPIIVLAVAMMEGLHPRTIEGFHIAMDPRMTLALLVNYAAFLLLGLYLLGRRVQLARAAEAVAELKERFRF
jgi:heme exporter protein C